MCVLICLVHAAGHNPPLYKKKPASNPAPQLSQPGVYVGQPVAMRPSTNRPYAEQANASAAAVAQPVPLERRMSDEDMEFAKKTSLIDEVTRAMKQEMRNILEPIDAELKAATQEQQRLAQEKAKLEASQPELESMQGRLAISQRVGISWL